MQIRLSQESRRERGESWQPASPPGILAAKRPGLASGQELVDSGNSFIETSVAAYPGCLRQTEELVREFDKKKPIKEDPNVKHLVNEISEKIGAPVQVKQGLGGRASW